MGHDVDTDNLLDRVAAGDREAVEQLLARYRERLKRMVNLRMDQRLASRIDGSDVIQETLTEASQRLCEYARLRPIPFYPWLRQIAWDKLVELHRWHFREKRSVTVEEPMEMHLSEESVCQLADCLVASQSSPSGRLVRKELVARVRRALNWLPLRERELLTLRHIEQLSTSETAAILGISESATKSRHFRAMRRLLQYLEDSEGRTSQ